MDWIVGVVAGLVAGVVTVVGNGLVIKKLRDQINALKGTIDTQEKTLKTIGEVNRTVLEVFRVIDPERWAKEVEIHKRLADEKAAAILEDERRRLEQEKGKVTEAMLGDLEGYVRLLLELMPYVPKAARQRLIEGLTISGMPRRIALDAAEKTPDWSGGGGLARLLQENVNETLFKNPPDAPDVTPPTTR